MNALSTLLRTFGAGAKKENLMRVGTDKLIINFNQDGLDHKFEIEKSGPYIRIDYFWLNNESWIHEFVIKTCDQKSHINIMHNSYHTIGELLDEAKLAEAFYRVELEKREELPVTKYVNEGVYRKRGTFEWVSE